MNLDPKILEQLSAYLDGALSPAEKAAVEALLARDAGVRKALEEMKALGRKMKDLPLLEPPEALYRRVLRDIEEPARRPFFSYFPLKTAGALMAAALVMVVTGDHWRAWMKGEEAAPSPLQMMQAPAMARQVETAKSLAPRAAQAPEAERRAIRRDEINMSLDKDAGLEKKQDAPTLKARGSTYDAVSSVQPLQGREAAGFGGAAGKLSDDKEAPLPAPAPQADKMESQGVRLAAASFRKKSMNAATPAKIGGAPSAAGLMVTNEETGQVSYGPASEWRGTDSAVKSPLALAARNEAEWRALWARHAPGQAAPPVDFTRWTAAAVFAGEEPTGGYGAQITDVSETRGETVVTYQVAAPPPGSFTTQAITFPYLIRLIPRADHVRFLKK